ncbi:PTS sugar transporter subunit IIB [Halanaerobium hydrogeniformans]|uniref:Phosphotransferase system lactose/cellobiose-specific IIB subunit n=1 Tax=Halanaerobium hydrogeniformans TaxID=656519 RepID=E4RNG3_HALHG|nr:PTS sugar transporter subunit IIB [Halanaerobium hydrogeniformans]ADQ13631.1 phosphotransferase system lactose/cellobiose-specific IIB subunit [Halanaerobium hydrogeniformans]
MKILLVCNAGMSTSLLVEKMKEAAENRELDILINAVSCGKFEDSFEEYDVVLLGPQIKYKEKSMRKIAEAKGTALDVVDSAAYGMVDGEKALDQAIQLVKQ